MSVLRFLPPGLFMLEFIEKLAFMEEAARPSFETVEGLQQALGKKLFTQEDITQKRLAVHDLLKAEYKKQHDGAELRE